MPKENTQEDIVYKGKVLATALAARRGYRLLTASEHFAFVMPIKENIVNAIPVTKHLKARTDIKPLDILKFRQGFLKLSEPWNYLAVLNGISGISSFEGVENITFEKFSEADWNEILPPIKESLEFNRFLLLDTPGSFEVQCPNCRATLSYEHDRQDWSVADEDYGDDAATAPPFCFTTECGKCAATIEIRVEGEPDRYSAREVTQ